MRKIYSICSYSIFIFIIFYGIYLKDKVPEDLRYLLFVFLCFLLYLPIFIWFLFDKNKGKDFNYDSSGVKKLIIGFLLVSFMLFTALISYIISKFK